MGVDQLPSGSYRARLMVDGQTYTATFPTEAEADEWLVVARGRAIEARRALIGASLLDVEPIERWNDLADLA